MKVYSNAEKHIISDVAMCCGISVDTAADVLNEIGWKGYTGAPVDIGELAELVSEWVEYNGV